MEIEGSTDLRRTFLRMNSNWHVNPTWMARVDRIR